jgi:hypothetical protein
MAKAYRVGAVVALSTRRGIKKHHDAHARDEGLASVDGAV